MFTPLQTERLTLRRIGPDDASDVYSYRSDPQVSQYQMWQPRSLEDTRSFLEELAAVEPNTPGTWLQLAIVGRDDHALIGDCGIRFLDHDPHQVELGITLKPSHQGQGLAKETLLAVMGYVFDTLGKHRVFGSVDPRNSASIALLERVGMRREAHLRESIYFNSEWLDDVIYALLDREWAERGK